MAMGEDGCFAWAMTYKEAVREGISKQSYFDDQRKDMTEEKFKMEYESIFLGAAEGAVLRYENGKSPKSKLLIMNHINDIIDVICEQN